MTATDQQRRDEAHRMTDRDNEKGKTQGLGFGFTVKQWQEAYLNHYLALSDWSTPDSLDDDCANLWEAILQTYHSTRPFDKGNKCVELLKAFALEQRTVPDDVRKAWIMARAPLIGGKKYIAVIDVFMGTTL